MRQKNQLKRNLIDNQLKVSKKKIDTILTYLDDCYDPINSFDLCETSISTNFFSESRLKKIDNNPSGIKYIEIGNIPDYAGTLLSGYRTLTPLNTLGNVINVRMPDYSISQVNLAQNNEIGCNYWNDKDLYFGSDKPIRYIGGFPLEYCKNSFRNGFNGSNYALLSNFKSLSFGLNPFNNLSNTFIPTFTYNSNGICQNSFEDSIFSRNSNQPFAAVVICDSYFRPDSDYHKIYKEQISKFKKNVKNGSLNYYKFLQKMFLKLFKKITSLTKLLSGLFQKSGFIDIRNIIRRNIKNLPHHSSDEHEFIYFMPSYLKYLIYYKKKFTHETRNQGLYYRTYK